MTSLPVVLYRYDASPFSHKVDHALLLKGIPHSIVNVSSMLPRPEITDQLGVSYRRIPILAIGNDVYCDSSLIVSALERRFPKKDGFGTLFPPHKNGGTDTGLIKAFAKFYGDGLLRHVAMGLLPWDKLPEAFVKDRSDLFGGPIVPEAVAASSGPTVSILSSHLALIEEQLSDGREWLFNTVSPSLADISVNFNFAWGKSFKGSDELLKAYPLTSQWLQRFADEIKKRSQTQGKPAKLSGDAASDLVVTKSASLRDEVGFDTVEAARLKVSKGDTVEIAPEDTGRTHPTRGTLVGLNKEEFVIETSGSKGTIHCHFPRFGFSLKKGGPSKL